MKINIVGAGIMGLSTAWALYRRGHTVTIFEQGPVPNPQAASGAPFIICSMHAADQSGKAQKQAPNDPRAHESCPFAAAAPLAAAPEAIALPAPQASGTAILSRTAFVDAVSPASYAPQSPRAPPISA